MTTKYIIEEIGANNHAVEVLLDPAPLLLLLPLLFLSSW
jgi:hypothetical protein